MLTCPLWISSYRGVGGGLYTFIFFAIFMASVYYSWNLLIFESFRLQSTKNQIYLSGFNSVELKDWSCYWLLFSSEVPDKMKMMLIIIWKKFELHFYLLLRVLAVIMIIWKWNFYSLLRIFKRLHASLSWISQFSMEDNTQSCTTTKRNIRKRETLFLFLFYLDRYIDRLYVYSVQELSKLS